MFGNLGSSSGVDRIIAQRRAEEAKIAQLERQTQQNLRLSAIANFESKSLAKQAALAQIGAPSAAEQERESAKAHLEQRRQQLRQLLDSEADQYKKEIDSKEETTEQRNTRLRARAKALREKRLKQKQEFVQQCKLQQFRESCDELRLNRGRNLTMECDRVRRRQMAEKALQREFESTEDDKWLQVWRDELQTKIDRDDREQKHKQQMNVDMAVGIRSQMEEIDQKRVEQRREKQKEIEERVRKMMEDEKATTEKQAELHKEFEKQRALYRQYYEEYQTKKIAEAAAEKKENQDYIRSVVEREAAEENKKVGKQKALRDDISAYLQYLNRLKEEKATAEKELDRLRQLELEQAWSQREMQWGKEKLAREQLLQTVFAERQDQMMYRQHLKTNASNHNADEKQRIQDDIQQYTDSEQNKLHNKIEENKKIQDFLKKQIEQHEIEKQRAHDDQLSFDLKAGKNDVEYKQLMQQQMSMDEETIRKGRTTHHYPKVSANWQTL